MWGWAGLLHTVDIHSYIFRSSLLPVKEAHTWHTEDQRPLCLESVTPQRVYPYTTGNTKIKRPDANYPTSFYLLTYSRAPLF